MTEEQKKIRVLLLYGGKSAEHEVSLMSAQSVARAMDRNKYDVTMIKIAKEGGWDLEILKAIFIEKPDVVFPVLHGTFGEDGTVQGLLKLAGVPFVGPSVLGSALGMDKDASKRLLREAGIPVARFIVFQDHQRDGIDFSEVSKELGLPVFVKPANLGSSVGVSRVENREQFEKAVDVAFTYDNKMLVEEYVRGREIECSVLGNDYPIASLPGEVVPNDTFYSYVAKYLDEKGALLKIPVELPGTVVQEVQHLAKQVFKTLCCQGMSRVDFFLTADGRVVVNEINTIPGFTNISMYPKLWEASGMSYPDLIDRLIGLAFERFEKEKKLRTDYV